MIPQYQHTQHAVSSSINKTLIVLLLGMVSAAGIFWLGALGSMATRRSRDVPARTLPEAALLKQLPASTRQVLACRPGWQALRRSLLPVLPVAMGQPLEGLVPVAWVGSWGISLQNPVALVAELAPGQIPPEKAATGSWQFADSFWSYSSDGMQAEPAGWPGGLEVVVRGRLPAEAVFWSAGVATTWQGSVGALLWGLAPAGAFLPSSQSEGWKSWVVWAEIQPDRWILRAEIECAGPREARQTEAWIEKRTGSGTGLHFLADGPWLSLQADLPQPP